MTAVSAVAVGVCPGGCSGGDVLSAGAHATRSITSGGADEVVVAAGRVGLSGRSDDCTRQSQGESSDRSDEGFEVHGLCVSCVVVLLFGEAFPPPMNTR